MGEVAEEKSRASVQAVLSSANPVLVAGLGFFQIGMSTRWLPLSGDATDLAAGVQSLILLSCFVAILTYALFLAFHSRVSLWLSSLGWKTVVGILSVAGVVAASLKAPLSDAGFASFWLVFFGFMSVAWYGGSLAGSALFDALRSMERLSAVWGAELVSVMAVLLLVVAYVFLFSEKDSDLMFGEERSSKKERAFHKACERLSTKGQLTAREQEVFYLLAKGAPVSTIEEKLYISGSTVSTHMKHIYQKLGVHSRGELYDMVDESLRTLPSEK